MLAAKNVLKGALDGGGACTGRTGDSDHGMFA
jgi:hypothetical protein